MWIFTKEGFFSVVDDQKYCQDDELMVRARVRGDLEKLKGKISTDPEVVVLPEADYLYRMPVLRKDWAQYLHDQAMELDYSNVKGNIADRMRQSHYFSVWSSMYQLQQKAMLQDEVLSEYLEVVDRSEI